MTDVLSDQLLEGTHLINFIRNTDKKGADALTPAVLRARLTLLDTYWDAVRERHRKLCRVESLKDDDYFEQDFYAVYEEAYVTARADLLTRLHGEEPHALTDATAAPVSRMPPAPPAAPPLPKLSLPRFSGRQEDWETFKERFGVMVKNVDAIPEIDKLQHLLSCLEGDAARRVKNFQVTAAHFQVAWDTLERRFDNKRHRLTALIKRIFTLQPITKRSASEITRLMDEIDQVTRSATLLQRPVQQWGDILVYAVVSRLDNPTREDWEKSLEGDTEFPTYIKLTTFLEARARTLETSEEPTCNISIVKQLHHSKDTNNKNSRNVSVHHGKTEISDKRPDKRSCLLCNGDHFLNWCPTFKEYAPEAKIGYVKDTKLCINCLRPGHIRSKCASKGRCQTSGCSAKHHTLLHESQAGARRDQTPESGERVPSGTVSTHAVVAVKPGKVVLLATAKIILETCNGQKLVVRALLDPASESSFISEKVALSLALNRKRASMAIVGVGASSNITTNYEAIITLRSRTAPDYAVLFTAIILPRVTSQLPGKRCQGGPWPQLQGLELADPNYNEPGPIDCLLGADVYPALIRQGLRTGRPNEPVAQNTALGWVLTGPASSTNGETATSTNSFHIQTCLVEEIQRFWEIEAVPNKAPRSQEEEQCEQHFINTHRRDQTGRFVLRLPFVRVPKLEGSRQIATARFLQTERRLQAKPALRLNYTRFMDEFRQLKHMELVPDSQHEQGYYMPHHAVLKKDSDKIRVVFNASQRTKSGLSLNDCLHAGPKLQSDISIIILRWRFFEYVFTADIVKMFRQFRMHPDDTDWLRVLWRDSPDHELQTFRMRTVVYGTACAPYLAQRALLQLAQDEEASYPQGANILRNHIYVDDALSGGHTLQEAQEAQRQLIAILRTAGMSLDKWSANRPELLNAKSSIRLSSLQFDELETSTLGLHWAPARDTFGFHISLDERGLTPTKRIMLSEIARLFDPLGWLAPAIVVAKILIQQLWIKGHDWDQPIDQETRAVWSTFREQLPELEKIQIPRWIDSRPGVPCFLHGFADASERAYAACIYIVNQQDDQSFKAHLLAAKTKVAPTKSLSIPRLELCAALLLVKLIQALAKDFRIKPARIFCWTDSQVVLAWLTAHPSKWATFVATRVGEILTLLPAATWQHVRSADNPADLASRGVLPSQLKDAQLWWAGPPWLQRDWHEWTATQEAFLTSLEEKKNVLSFATQGQPPERPFEVLISRFSSMIRLTRSLAYALRWFSNAKLDQETRARGDLVASEIIYARKFIVRCVQREFYQEELRSLSTKDELPMSFNLRRFLPFIDEDGVIRIGGRLQNAYLAYDEKHPMIVPPDSHLTELLIREAHLKTLHGGPQLITSYLLRSVFIARARNRVRRLTKQCVTCTRFRGQLQQQRMAPLPASRVTPSRPFSATGLDYAGPFPLRTSKGRGQKSYKGYVAIFVCMVTRAIHIEVVSDLTSHGFMQAFRRFVARRGLCATIFSDNGTNLRGASSELKKLFHQASQMSQEIANALCNDGVDWKFIPPRAPHFGGLWEAAVRAFKHHLRRVLGDHKLTYEEFATLTATIEACLNSRPLSPLSSDPTDLAALTAGHFLIGAPLTAPPEPCQADATLSAVTRLHLITQMRNSFWMRWQKEVLQHMQPRSKWHTQNTDIKTGDMVLITDELLPPTKWPLARVQQCHPGPDGLVRVLTLKTATTTLQRPLAKVVKLIVDDQPSQPNPADQPPEETDPHMAGGLPTHQL